jgi:hypothetical protein
VATRGSTVRPLNQRTTRSFTIAHTHSHSRTHSHTYTFTHTLTPTRDISKHLASYSHTRVWMCSMSVVSKFAQQHLLHFALTRLNIPWSVHCVGVMRPLPALLIARSGLGELRFEWTKMVCPAAVPSLLVLRGWRQRLSGRAYDKQCPYSTLCIPLYIGIHIHIHIPYTSGGS